MNPVPVLLFDQLHHHFQSIRVLIDTSIIWQWIHLHNTLPISEGGVSRLVQFSSIRVGTK